jgi:hypothetical protein
VLSTPDDEVEVAPIRRKNSDYLRHFAAGYSIS